MTFLLDQRWIITDVPTTPPPIDFAYEKNERSMVSRRYLRVNGQRTFELSVMCDTCSFLFEHIQDANHEIAVHALTEQFRRGVPSLTPAIVAMGSRLLPAGSYYVMLLELAPERITPGDANNYFTHEQLTLWSAADFGGVPHGPKTEYYRTPVHSIAHRAALYEFVIPMIPSDHLNAATVSGYQQQHTDEHIPTALAISVLDVKQPDLCDREEQSKLHGELDITQHWCLAHFILDGHHKLAAAALSHRPIRLVTFLAINDSVATGDQIASLIRVLEAT